MTALGSVEGEGSDAEQARSDADGAEADRGPEHERQRPTQRARQEAAVGWQEHERRRARHEQSDGDGGGLAYPARASERRRGGEDPERREERDRRQRVGEEPGAPDLPERLTAEGHDDRRAQDGRDRGRDADGGDQEDDGASERAERLRRAGEAAHHEHHEERAGEVRDLGEQHVRRRPRPEVRHEIAGGRREHQEPEAAWRLDQHRRGQHRVRREQEGAGDVRKVGTRRQRRGREAADEDDQDAPGCAPRGRPPHHRPGLWHGLVGVATASTRDVVATRLHFWVMTTRLSSRYVMLPLSPRQSQHVAQESFLRT